MSVVAGIETELAPLVWESVELPCESIKHEDPVARAQGAHADGPATHYLMMAHQCMWGTKGEAVAGCAALAARVGAAPEKERILCYTCGSILAGKKDWMYVLGPVST